MTLFTVIGNPVGHSLSPQIHHMFAQQFGIELRYTRSLSSVARFPRTVSEFFRHGGGGANVTVPFKQAAYALCSTYSPRAQAAAAVNTLQRGANGQLYGDNTDGLGLVTDLQRQLGQLSGAKVLVLGAGGATRGVILPLLQAGVASIIVANRTLSRAQQLLQQLMPYLSHGERQRVAVVALSDVTTQHCHQAIIVNATSAGWHGQSLTLAGVSLRPSIWVYDMNYGATPTPFLQQAEQAGALGRSDGLGMLVEQAAASFALWHPGLTPATEEVLGQLRSVLQG
jgi:shikimate dehydrogenase